MALVRVPLHRRRPTPRSIPTWDGDAAALAGELQRRIEGEVRFDDGARALYSTDASNYRQVPIGVVVPRTVDDVVAAVEVCREHGAPLTSRGGGTSLAGQTCNLAVVIDWSKHVREILEIDPDARLARVQPGLVLDHLEGATVEHGLRFAPDPSTHNRCTIGGMIGNNSCGVHSVLGGKTVDNVESLEVLTYDGTRMEVGATSEEELARIIAAGGRRGELYGRLRDLRDRYAEQIRDRFPEIPRRVSGYNLDQLLPESGFHVARALVGTEGTCATVLSATLNLAENPPHRALAILGFQDVFEAADAVPDVLRFEPVGLEGLDDFLVGNLARKRQEGEGRGLLPDGGGWLLAEFGGQTQEEADERARALIEEVPGDAEHRLLTDPAEQQEVWEVREAGLGATAQVPGDPDAWPGWEDSAVAPDRLGPYLRDLQGLYDEYGYQGSYYGHFGDGCLHVRTSFDLTTAGGVADFRRFVHDAARLVTSYGGSMSGEHGDGIARGELLPIMFGEELVGAFREFKAIWDPDDRMNPGKVVRPARVDEHLRYGADYRPWEPETVFAYPNDDGSFARSQVRCVGVGECRKTESGTMCPSYMATREEMHSTRGRARLLWELLEGNPLTDGWREEAVHEALDLCLSCKACKSECPMNVDMATYKAEFLHHHWKGRIRPVAAYALGLIPFAARIASRVPRLANALTHAPVLSTAVKRLGGVAAARTAPTFARETLAEWIGKRPAREGEPVVLYLDTFTNFFTPEVGRAAVAVLEDAGYAVRVPERTLCCARPLYEFGMIPTATRMLDGVLETLRPHLRSGTPILVLEPSCAAVFRDELLELRPGDEDAKRLAGQVVTLAELLAADDGYEPPRIDRSVLVQQHCHQDAVIGHDADNAILAATGADVTVLDSGCCGMAGSFGYEDHKYEVSVAVGERVLLPAVREAPEGTIVLANGFSCRSQVEDLAGREALHLAQLLALGLDGPAAEEEDGGAATRRPALAAVVGAGVLAAGAAVAMRRRST